jgi:signal transduction histidine kinase/ligand-binding sensor domain-containing protein
MKKLTLNDSVLSFFKYVLTISLFFCLMPLGAQEIQKTKVQQGRPFIRNYTIKEYRAQQQNWTIAQDQQGLMIFGNSGGLLSFDGHNWELMKLPIMRAMEADSAGKIYMGMENNFGYLESDNNGNFLFHSLKPLLPEKYQDVTPVYSLVILRDKIIFQTNEYLFIYSNEKFTVIPARTSFHRAYNVRNRLYVRENDKGLYYLENDSLIWIEGSEFFANERIYGMLPYGKDEILIITMQQGAIIYSPDGLIKFNIPEKFTELNKFLAVNWPYCGIVLPDGDYAIGTVTAGIVVFSDDGAIRTYYDKKSGLQDNTVYVLYCDENKNLWAALDNGISRIDYELPFVHYTEQEGLLGSVLFVKNFKEYLYIGTGQHLHLMKPDGSFEIISGTHGQSFDIVEANDILLLAHNPGIYEVKGNRAFMLPNSSDISATCFGTLKKHPEQLLVGAQNGFVLLGFNGKTWEVKHNVKGFNFPIYMFMEDFTRDFWVSSLSSLYKVRINEVTDSVVHWREYPAGRGLPYENGFPFMLNSGEVVISTEAGIFRHIAKTDSFERHPEFLMITGKVTSFLQQPNGDIWFEESLGNFTYHKGVLRYENGKYTAFNKPFLKFNDSNLNESPPNICILPDGEVLFGTNMGLLKYLPEKDRNSSRSFGTRIRKVYAKDSLIFGGNLNMYREVDAGQVEVPWLFHDMTFHYSATFYEDAEKNLFSYRLIGMDSTWSAWSSDNKKEYTNLREGEYIFEVKSRNQYLVEGSVATFGFEVLAPWYRRWWMYMTYILAGGLAVYMLVFLRTRNLRVRSLLLKKAVRERTNEIRNQKNNIEKLSKIGRDITSSLSIENIIKTVYENVNTLMDASVFTIGLYNHDINSLEFPAAIEKGELLPAFSIMLTQENRLAVWCFKNREEVFINDYAKDYGRYVKNLTDPIAGESPESILYLPLWNKNKVIGVISAQSFRKDAYTNYHINILRNLATYSAIALENADAYRHLAQLLEDLKTAQDRLVNQSKLAALGELTAGIAHEIQNPLNFVNNFAEVSSELIDEMKDELQKKNYDEAISIISGIKQNLDKITYHGKRADSIVKGMLQHSRGTSGLKQPTDINSLCDEFLRLVYHGFRAKDKLFNVNIITDFDKTLEKVEVIPQDMGRVVLNLISNAFYAVTEKKKHSHDGYEPTVWVMTKRMGSRVEIIVRDNGTGIPPAILDKIFQPFFTTKPAGQGTGLGLSLSYESITIGHGGELIVETKEGEESIFTVQLPVK